MNLDESSTTFLPHCNIIQHLKHYQLQNCPLDTLQQMHLDNLQSSRQQD